jgi:hypothetical protein
MIYITHNFTDDVSFIKNVWNVNCINLDKRYSKFLKNKARKLNIVINDNYYNIMNYEVHNKHLSKKEYSKKIILWNGILKKWNIDTYILEILKGKKENFKTFFL